MKILLGIDTSAHSSSTVAYVCRTAWPAGTSVLVLSAVAPTEPQYAPEPIVLASVAGALAVVETCAIRKHEERVARTEQSLRKAGLEVRSEVVYGDPRHILVEAARVEGVDLVVVGSHGHRIGRRMMGSVASYVVEHAPCEVLVIKRDYANLLD